MNTITIKGEQRTKEKDKVKLIMVFHKTGFCRAKKVIDITGNFKDWDDKRQQFRSNSSENEEKNKCLSELRRKYKKVAETWDQEERIWSPTQWAGCFDFEEKVEQDKMMVKSVYHTIDILIEYFGNKKRIKNGVEVSSYSNVREYKFLKSSLSEFTRQKYNKQLQSFHFNHITKEFLHDYAVFLQLKGAKNGNKGGVIHKLRKLRAVVSYAFNTLKNPNADTGAFAGVENKMKHTKFMPKSIPHSVILQIEKLDKKQFSKIEQFHLDLFLFSFYAGGMCNIDVAYLNWNSVKSEDVIEYERIKICKEARVPLIDKAKAILKKYRGKGYENYVFPVFTHKHITEQQKRDRLERLYYKMGQTLEKVRIKVGYKEKITWNSARGSYITKMLEDGFSASLVAAHAGNSERIISRHYYKAMDESDTKQKMNSNFHG
ncbi:tyrosine-type recombinase/integrase [Dysgonomonas sp. GY75]|uniref:tyrosine-type recombinase/integrase n=1 Tax=Dysgonomonas sp. GY75 TaxID=2780419 RepID=UPI0018834444|nr:tyrosine-type recombinase/integrase [Dysgonomonas sp. GY75]MBF0648572.1 tyrosine-type recombinase/integrase [Dysgonomonas sp. GY75]